MAEERPQIPPPRFAVREFNTPNFADGFYTEVFKRTDPAYMHVQVPKRGTLYSTIVGANPQVIALFPNLYFLKETRLGNSHEWVTWVWGSDPAAEDTYNAEVGYSGENPSFPTFVRSYTVRRDTYEAAPSKAGLSSVTALLGVHITAQGSGYTTASASFTGSGSGATIQFIIAAGKIIAGIVTNSGTGFLSTDTLTINGDGVGATGTLIIQPVGAVLTSQKKQEFPQDHPLFWEYVRVTRVYETLPGPLLSKPGFNSSLGNATTEYRQRVALPASPDALGSVISGQTVVDSFVDNEGSTLAGTRITECWTIPPSRTERQSIGYQFPAQFNYIGPWAIPVLPGFQIPGPFPGVNFTLTAHRTLSTPAFVDISYTNGQPTISETVFEVTTPGAADRFFKIQANTIHNLIHIVETEIAGMQVVEDLPASTPSSYTPGSTLTIRVTSRLIKGTIYEKTVVTCAE